jgi:tetratricopeptide (TPR) repeat protein
MHENVKLDEKLQAEHVDAILAVQADDDLIRYFFFLKNFIQNVIFNKPFFCREVRKEWECSPDDVNVYFQYAAVLAKSNNAMDKREAIYLLQNLVRTECYKEAMFCLAETYYTLEEYDNARTCCEELLRSFPDDKQVTFFFIFFIIIIFFSLSIVKTFLI